MKRLAGCIALALVYSAGAMAANDAWIVSSDEARADFYVKFSGEVPKRCEMRANGDLKNMTFDLKKRTDTKAFKFTAWCNSYGTKANVLIDPFAFKNANGDEIPMEYSFNNVTKMKDENIGWDAARIYESVDISNDIDKAMSDQKTVMIKAKPQAGAKWGEYSGSMYVTLFHN